MSGRGKGGKGLGKGGAKRHRKVEDLIKKIISVVQKNVYEYLMYRGELQVKSGIYFQTLYGFGG